MVTIRVPGTTSNLGPGFDCLGIALHLYNDITVTRAEQPGLTGMAADTADLFFKTSGINPFAVSWQIKGEVPQSRGLGSSVTVRLGLLHALNELAGQPLDTIRLFELCSQLEGHPDNAAPAAFGGFTVAKPGSPTLRADVNPSLSFVLLIPDFEVSTPKARSVLPTSIDRLSAVASSVNAARITAAFLQHRYDCLRGAFDDGLHQPFREPLIPFLRQVIAAGEAAGALGGFLSGSGSTICCLTLENPEAVAAAMLDASGSPGARTLITTADNRGARLI